MILARDHLTIRDPGLLIRFVRVPQLAHRTSKPLRCFSQLSEEPGRLLDARTPAVTKHTCDRRDSTILPFTVLNLSNAVEGEGWSHVSHGEGREAGFSFNWSGQNRRRGSGDKSRRTIRKAKGKVVFPK